MLNNVKNCKTEVSSLSTIINKMMSALHTDTFALHNIDLFIYFLIYRIGKNYDQIIDVDWRQDYIIKVYNLISINYL